MQDVREGASAVSAARLMALFDIASLLLIVVAGFVGAPWWIVVLGVAWWLKLESGEAPL